MADIVLQTEGLTKRYGALVAVHDLNLAVQAGEVFGFLGPNGAGKTTSIHMMVGLLPPDAGRVLVHGKALVSDRQLRARVGVCPQEIRIWEKLTCLEQLVFIGAMYGLSRRQARQRAVALLEAMRLEEKANRQAGTLSGGMKRRLNLILALVHDPDLVVLDEPEAGLDPQSRVLVREFIRSLARTKTVILTTHNMDEAERLADRVAIIDHGRLLVVDTPAQLKRQVGEAEILELRLEEISQTEQARQVLLEQSGEMDVRDVDGLLLVRSGAAAARLPRLLDGLSRAGVGIAEVRLRQSSLEDVFIHLTGRRLRE